jgi:hypothetical protein
MIRGMRGALALVLLAAASPAQDGGERAAIEAFRRAWQEAADLDQRRAALVLLDGRDSQHVARALLAVHAKVARRLAEIDAERLELGDRLAATYADPAEQRRRGLVRTEQARRAELRGSSFPLRGEADALRGAEIVLRQRIARLAAPDAHAWMAEQVLGRRGVPLRLQIEVARLLGGDAERGVPALLRALQRAREPAPRAAMLLGLQRAGRAAAAAAASVMALLTDDSAAVREHAASALAVFAVPQAIEPMIALLEREQGQTRNRVARSLEILTRQQLGTIAPAWRAWYADHRTALLAGEIALGDGAPRQSKPVAPGGSAYMGLPQDGRSIVYVVDASESMRAKVDFAVPGTTTALGAGATRFSACQTELIRALGLLSGEQRFNIVAFHEAALRFRDAPVPATAENIAAGQSWVRALEMSLFTNMHDALQVALAQLAGDPEQRAAGDAIDTIFLLSDGAPVIADPDEQRRGVQDPPAAIVAALRDWDPLQRVTLHSIGIGKGLRRQFLEAMARAGGGEARFY